MEPTPEQSVMPVIAGILSIISGGAKILAFFGILFAALFVPVATGFGFPVIAISLFFLLEAVLLILGILAVIGGVNTLQRTKYGMAVTGAIAALLPLNLLGVAALVLVILSKDEFS